MPERLSPRYPELRVSIRSHNPLALVAAVREELRLARAERRDISSFTDQALAHPSESHVLEVAELGVAAGEVPEPLRGIAVRTLDLGLLQAGAGIKGEFENRLKSVIAKKSIALAEGVRILSLAEAAAEMPEVVTAHLGRLAELRTLYLDGCFGVVDAALAMESGATVVSPDVANAPVNDVDRLVTGLARSTGRRSQATPCCATQCRGHVSAGRSGARRTCSSRRIWR
mgnify:CR=1 FL=1